MERSYWDASRRGWAPGLPEAVGDLLRTQGQAPVVRVGVVIGVRGHVGEDGLARADVFEAVPDAGRDDEEAGAGVAEVVLGEGSKGGALFAAGEEDELEKALADEEAVDVLGVAAPAGDG